MTELEARIKAKIPGEDTGIEVKKTLCDMCTPLCHCGIDAYVRDGELIKIEGTKGHPMNAGVSGPGKNILLHRATHPGEKISAAAKLILQRSGMPDDVIKALGGEDA